jgi:probable F420-dependent oxidoreductase
MSDHVAITPSVAQRYPEPFFDALTTLAWIAGRTQRVDLGTTVIVLPYRHPILLARQVANLDVLSGGRVILGVGIGNAADEFAALGVPHNRRGAWSDEMLEAMRALWSGSGEVTYEGRHIKFERISAIHAAQRPHPRLWVGGNSDAALRRAVRHDAWWHPINQPVSALRERLPALRAEAAAAGKPVPGLMPRIRLNITADTLPEEGRAPGTGSVEQVHDDLRELHDLDAQYVVLDWYNGPQDLDGTRAHERAFAMLALLADQVLDLAHEALR